MHCFFESKGWKWNEKNGNDAENLLIVYTRSVEENRGCESLTTLKSKQKI